jgi:hypothetical protein
MIELTTPHIGHEFAEIVRANGWIQGDLENRGKVCAHGAVMRCDMKPGDKEVVRSVMRKKGLTERWNDADDRTEEEVLAALEAFEVSDADLTETFGPQWEEILALVRKVTQLTSEQFEKLAIASKANRQGSWAAVDAAWAAANGSAAVDTAVRTVAQAAWVAVDEGGYDSGSSGEWGAGAAAWAISTRHLIGSGSYTQDHHDLLLKPWLAVFPV